MTIYRHRVSGPGPAGDIWTSTMHSSSVSGSIQTIQAAWVALVTAMFGGHYGGMLTVDQQATQCVTDALDPTTGKNTAQVVTAIGLKGTLAAEPTTPQRAAIVLGLRTLLPTRAGRGRMFWPGPAGSVLTVTGELQATDVTALATQLAGALGTFNGTSQAVIYHRANPKASPPTLPSSTNVTSVTVGVVLGTQRRRTNKVAASYASAAI